MTPELFNKYRLGIPTIDDHHWTIFVLMDKILLQAATDPNKVHASLVELLRELTSHSDDEIQLMRDMNFPFIDTHIVEHTLLAHCVERAIENALNLDHSDITTNAEQVFIDHIVQYDALYAEYAATMNKQLTLHPT